MRGELQAPLRDVGKVAEAAGVEDRPGQVGVRPRNQIGEGDQGQHHKRGGHHEQRRAPAPRRDRGSGNGAANGQHDRRPDIGPEATGGKDEREEEADG